MARRDSEGRTGDGRTGTGLDGILVVAKPPGPTSHDVVALVRRLAATRRVGHGGTLDPFAAGVLPLFLGRATRLVEYHQADRKQYRATVCFGARSTTDDLEGELSPVAGPVIGREAVERALASFVGTIEQQPPAFSALRVAGRRAYALARAGEMPNLAPRSVVIHRLELIEWDDRDPARPVAIVEVDCAPGTYVRAIARDLGAAVGSGAYLGALVRTRSGPFRLDDAIGLDDLRAAAAESSAALRRHLLPIDAGLESLPLVTLSADEIRDVGEGRFVRPAGGVPGGAGEGPFRLVDAAGHLVAIARRVGPRLAPTKVLIATGGSVKGAVAGPGSAS